MNILSKIGTIRKKESDEARYEKHCNKKEELNKLKMEHAKLKDKRTIENAIRQEKKDISNLKHQKTKDTIKNIAKGIKGLKKGIQKAKGSIGSGRNEEIYGGSNSNLSSIYGGTRNPIYGSPKKKASKKRGITIHINR